MLNHPPPLQLPALPHLSLPPWCIVTTHFLSIHLGDTGEHTIRSRSGALAGINVLRTMDGSSYCRQCGGTLLIPVKGPYLMNQDCWCCSNAKLPVSECQKCLYSYSLSQTMEPRVSNPKKKYRFFSRCSSQNEHFDFKCLVTKTAHKQQTLEGLLLLTAD